MKKTFLVLAGLTVGAFASYLEMSYMNYGSASDKVLAVQPLKELVGENLKVVKISYGKETTAKDMLGSRYGGYFSLGKSDNNINEYTIGLDFTIKSPKLSYGGFQPYFGGQVGWGYKNDEGTIQDVSTKQNVVTYITETDYTHLMVPDRIKFSDNTAWFESGLSLGVEKDLTKKSKIKLGGFFIKRSYEISYVHESSVNITNGLNPDGNYYGFQISFTKSF